MEVVCTECGCPYDSHRQSCPECGCPTITTQPAGLVTITNCPNCGAPVGRGIDCDYCGSAYPRVVQQTPKQVIINKKSDESSAVLAGFLGGIVGSKLF